MIQKQWEDCDLTRISLNDKLGQLTVELSNNDDGETIAVLVCKGLLSLKLSSALVFDESELPVFVGKVELQKLEEINANAYLQSHRYGFSRFGSAMPFGINTIWRVHIEGGEIDFEALVKDCEIM